jgi:Zn-dependent protease
VDPLECAFPLLRLGRLQIRIHWVLALYVTCELLSSLPDAIQYRAILMASMVWVVLAREVGRGVWARIIGSRLDHVTLWPVGGLNPASSPRTARPALAEFGGLLTGIVLLGTLAAAAVWVGVPRTLLYSFNPFAPGEVLGRELTFDSPVRLVLWCAFYANAVVLALNLLPMFPMDGGRVLAALVRQRDMYQASNEQAGRFGMFTSVALFILAATADQTRLMALAAAGFVATLVEFHQIQTFSLPSKGLAESDEAPEPTQPTRRAPGRTDYTAPRDDVQSDLDHVLAKISRAGLSSLSAPERALLTRETERRRRG